MKRTLTEGMVSSNLHALSKSLVAAVILPRLRWIADLRWYHDDHRMLEKKDYE